MKNAIRIIGSVLFTVVLLLLLIAYLVPQTTSLDAELYGVVVTKDGQILYKTDVTVSGSIQDYFFENFTEDSMSLEFQIQNWGHQDGTSQRLVYNRDPHWRQSEHYGYRSGLYSIKRDGAYIHGYWGLTNELDALIVTRFDSDSEYLVASADPEFDPKEILECFAGVIDRTEESKENFT